MARFKVLLHDKLLSACVQRMQVVGATTEGRVEQEEVGDGVEGRGLREKLWKEREVWIAGDLDVMMMMRMYRNQGGTRWCRWICE